MISSRAKQFEQKFRKDWQKTFPEGICFRLNDQVTGYKTTSQNPSDFICFANGHLFFIEAKTREGASINFDSIPQYDRLLKFVGKQDCFCGIILWLYEHNEVGIIYIPVSTIKKMKADGLKSFGIRHLNNEKYPSYQLPTLKQMPVFLDTDYSPLMNLKDGE